MNLQFIAFLSFIIVSLILSIWLEVKMQKNTNSILAAMSIAFNINLLVLGSGSLWLLLNSDSSLNIYSGVFTLIVAFIGIFFINILVMLFLRQRIVE